MARYHGATWRPVDRYQSGPLHVAMTPRRLVLHTAVTNQTPSLHGFFNVSGRATPHFYVGKNGEVEQYIDTDFRGSANLDGNWNCIGVETWDGFGDSWSGGGPGPRWTDKQVESLALLAAWCNREHGIPLKALRSSQRLGRGVGWHRLGIDGNFPKTWPLYGRKLGGEHWSLSAGKVCPTDTRIRQTPNEILPRARHILSGGPSVPKPQPERDKGNVEHAISDLHKSVKAMKPSKKRSKIRAALRLLRGVVASKKQRRHPHERERTPNENRNEKE